MDAFYVFNEYGDFQFTTTDEDYASAWCDANEGYYCWEELKEVSIKEKVELLNSCAGNECCAYWEYRVIGNKIYEVIKRKKQKIVAKKNFLKWG